jgi:hypothetical protein
MAPAVRDAFVELYRDQTGAGEADAQQWLEKLEADERYQQDVFARVRPADAPPRGRAGRPETPRPADAGRTDSTVIARQKGQITVGHRAC